MGITVVQKSDLSRKRPNAKKAIVLAGGAISGGAFKVGGLLALNRFLRNISVTNFETYVGISAGAFLAAPLAAGIEPFELVQALRGSSGRLTRFSYVDFYRPAWKQFLRGPTRFARDAMTIYPRLPWAMMRAAHSRRRTIEERAKAFLADPGLATAEALFEPIGEALEKGLLKDAGGYVPAGIFDNSGIARYVAKNLERNNLPSDFRELKLLTGKSLYIVATNLNSAQGVVFGHDEDDSVSIPEAVQASTAIPGFFVPARIGPEGRQQDFLDAAVRKTANISTAVRHNAELIICYNPFRPFVNYRYRPGTKDQLSLADLGIGAVLNQAFRTMLHSRLRLGIEKLRLDESFRGDVILIEPAETDSRFFAMNPLSFWRRAEAATHGYQSVKTSLEKHYEPLRNILGAYGIDADLDAMEGEFAAIRDARGATAKLNVMEESRPRRAGLRLVSGG
ncbi:MAG: patatin-like phospholipase family protein [Myxococcota bacterium]